MSMRMPGGEKHVGVVVQGGGAEKTGKTRGATKEKGKERNRSEKIVLEATGTGGGEGAIIREVTEGFGEYLQRV